MVKTIRVLKIEAARLNEVSGRRIPVADFDGNIEIIEEQSMVAVLGRQCKGEKKILASVILCNDVQYLTQSAFSTAKTYEAEGDVTGERKTEKLLFSGLRFADNDPVSGTLTFEITDLNLIEMLLNI
jgi:hypothetical protein